MNKIKNMLLTMILVFMTTIFIGASNVIMIASWLLCLMGVWSIWCSIVVTVLSALPCAAMMIWCMEEKTDENKKKTR